MPSDPWEMFCCSGGQEGLWVPPRSPTVCPRGFPGAEKLGVRPRPWDFSVQLSGLRSGEGKEHGLCISPHARQPWPPAPEPRPHSALRVGDGPRASMGLRPTRPLAPPCRQPRPGLFKVKDSQVTGPATGSCLCPLPEANEAERAGLCLQPVLCCRSEWGLPTVPQSPRV